MTDRTDAPPLNDRPPPRESWRDWIRDLWWFGLKEAWASLFGGLLLAAILVTAFWWPDGMPLYRYDFLFLFALTVQITLLATGLESPREAIVIGVFHVVATGMELFKTHVGSWSYPEPSLFRIALPGSNGGGVPLFAGFMYSAVGSYIARAWRVMDLRFTNYPPLWQTGALAAAIYANFFTHHYTFDLRWPLVIASVVIYGRCVIHYRPVRRYRRMPQVVGNLLVALFIWFAENIATYARVWVYPNQRGGWELVKLEKLVAWYLLMLLSGFLVTLVHRPREFDQSALPGK